MKNIHVRFEYEEAVENKKEILTTQLNVLQLLKRVSNYKKLRKRELITKNKIKTAATKLKDNLKELETLLPEESGEVHIERKGKRKSKKQETEEIEKSKNIEHQLSDIKERLAKL